METIQEAKDFLRANYKKGCDCPACGHYVREYKRKLNSGMALFLIGIAKLIRRDKPGLRKVFYSNKEIMEVMNLKVTSLDYSVLKHFDLIEARKSEDGKKDSGYWTLTPGGHFFSLGSVEVSKYVFLYNNKRQGLSDETITIKEALGSKFDYKELMNA